MGNIEDIRIARNKKLPPASSDIADASTVVSLFFKSVVSIAPDITGSYCIKTYEPFDLKTYEGRCLERITYIFEGVRFKTPLDAVLAMLDSSSEQREIDELLEQEIEGNQLK